MSWFGHHHHNQPAPPASGPNQVFKIFCRANENYCLAVRDGAVVLAPVNPKDDHQHWYKDMRFSTRVKDEEGMPAFALWTESRDVGNGFRCVRMVNNIYLNFDAFHGDKAHGGVHDGTEIVLWKWCEGDNQRWKILPW
ncbi:hydroxyproline-rich glycoprotein family protein [Zea mays]|uniref:Hydroxyproline-rich glycoprotein family protein n=1 Tax=Zea mays TaxID=4577 RepID=A0A1D6IMJ6_MAIZE|nr:hydroxyproline-rich glycoprotein family protein [Zea mays]ONM60507.1 hydroxyproline-rich glycoprotein family protein [Zea mays]